MHFVLCSQGDQNEDIVMIVDSDGLKAQTAEAILKDEGSTWFKVIAKIPSIEWVADSVEGRRRLSDFIGPHICFDWEYKDRQVTFDRVPVEVIHYNQPRTIGLRRDFLRKLERAEFEKLLDLWSAKKYGAENIQLTLIVKLRTLLDAVYG